jgi:hypothetical protein
MYKTENFDYREQLKRRETLLKRLKNPARALVLWYLVMGSHSTSQSDPAERPLPGTLVSKLFLAESQPSSQGELQLCAQAIPQLAAEKKTGKIPRLQQQHIFSISFLSCFRRKSED